MAARQQLLHAAAPTSTSSSPASATTVGAAEQWASGLCGALSAWEASVRMHTRPDPTPTATGQAAAERLRNEARARLNAVEKATDRLRSDLKKLGPPKTGAGAAISTELSSLSDRLRSSVNELRSMATAPVSSMDELQAQAAQVRTIAATARQDLRRSVDRVKSLEPAGELSTALASAPACRVLRREQSSGTPTG